MACTQRVVNMIHLHLVSATNRSETRTHGNTAESGPLSTYESISVASYVISHPSASNTTLTCTSTPPHESDLPRNKNKNIISALLASTGHSSAAAGGQRKKSGNASSGAQIADQTLDTRLWAPSRGIRVLEGLPMPGVNDDGGERPLGALAAGVPPPAMELHAKKRRRYVLQLARF